MKASFIINKLDLSIPLIGVYDAPGDTDFGQVKTPPGNRHSCFFAFYKSWEKGTTLKLSHNNYGCGGCGSWLFGEITKTRKEYVKFLADDEGLKANHELMDEWLDDVHAYKPEHGFLFIGPLKDEHAQYLKTITFFVNPDQLSVLMIGAQYYHRPGDPVPVLAPFGSGCMEMLSHFTDLDIPQAVIGATDLAMRKYLPPEILAFTVTVPMFEQLCKIDKNSFLEKRFLKDLKKARKGRL
ncbi:MAG: DUF169 domain-containing protein [Bacteroidetes bacterium]|nr:DUF169 domain-containing protein [Bacteroidota bacterium]